MSDHVTLTRFFFFHRHVSTPEFQRGARTLSALGSGGKLPASRRRLPSARVLLVRSLPARSTRHSWLTATWLLSWAETRGPSIPDNSLSTHSYEGHVPDRKGTHLEDVVSVCIQGRLGKFDDEHAVGAAGFFVQLGVGNPPLLLTWGQKHTFQSRVLADVRPSWYL